MSDIKDFFWIQLKNKDQKIFTIFFNSIYPKLFSIAYKAISEKETCLNIIQESFLIFWNKLDVIKPEKKYIESYLIRILKNKIIDYYRSNKRTILSIDDVSFEIESDNDEINFDLDEDVIEIIKKSIDNLPLKIKDVFILSKFEGLTYKEIASKKRYLLKLLKPILPKH